MSTAHDTSLILLTVLDTALLLAYARIFTRGAEGLGRGGRGILVATIAMSLAAIGLRSALLRACPLLYWEDFLAFVALSILSIYLVLEMRIGDRTTGVFAVAPSVLMSLVSTIAIIGRETPGRSVMGAIDATHVFAAVLGFSAVVLCGVYGSLYLFLYWAIKRGRFGLFFKKMPPLETLSNLDYLSAWMAFVALTVTLTLGFFAHRGAGVSTVSLTHPMIILTAALWLIYGLSIAGWRFFAVGGKRLAYSTVLGFLVLLGILCWGVLRQGFHG